MASSEGQELVGLDLIGAADESRYDRKRQAVGVCRPTLDAEHRAGTRQVPTPISSFARPRGPRVESTGYPREVALLPAHGDMDA